jgi:hypothetical protein
MPDPQHCPQLLKLYRTQQRPYISLAQSAWADAGLPPLFYLFIISCLKFSSTEFFFQMFLRGAGEQRPGLDAVQPALQQEAGRRSPPPAAPRRVNRHGGGLDPRQRRR